MGRTPNLRRLIPARGLSALLVLALTFVSAVACSTDNTYTPDLGRYVNESISGQDDIRTLFENTTIIVEVSRQEDETHVSWQAACNIMSAPAVLKQSRLVLRDEVISTAMACETERETEQDEWLTEFFTSEPLWQQQDDTLVVRSEDLTTTVEFREASSEGEETE